MELFILWVGFAGAWLLVAGPVFQASIELREEQLDRESIVAATRDVPQPKRVSGWWWLLPPVAYVLMQRAQSDHRQAAMAALPQDLREQFVGFAQKARGWLIVAAGAYLIAGKETWELAEAYDWPVWVFWLLVVLMPVLCLFFTVNSVVQSEKAAGHARPERRPRPGRKRGSGSGDPEV
ncbi:hypothetical protein [Gryllotalpicola ginsengisoli]|uniref:hypothetical protein n=1 Tax=Gryllotalpicola ginsengisoli TaxID=444608 RepID=UPI0003B78D91|nr:hypothetical protein [Gryllotalpicola ginsengisoli]